MPNELERERVRALARARSHLRHNDRSLEDRRTHIEEATAFYKEKLIKTAEAGEKTQALDLVHRLVELRARLSVVEIEELRDAEVILDSKETKRIMERYRTDCILLALGTDRLLGIEHTL